jgi:3',5'-cyclic AMP phosphodiesterase CpdA
MPPLPKPTIAVIADAHFHDPKADFGAEGVVVGGQRLLLRSFADSMKSTRLFNESDRALRHALDDISRRGIRHVVLLGDYSDDGQAATLKALKALLDRYRSLGMRFYAVPGNHDIFGLSGRHRAKRFLNTDGGTDLVTSDPQRITAPEEDRVIVSTAMRCVGYPDGLPYQTGFFRSPDYLHWETPFGPDDAPEDRLYDARSPQGTARRQLMDASYLVEPIEGLWLLMIDANVFVPIEGAAGDDEATLTDSSDAGWNAMLTGKHFVLEWIKDVSGRARRLGKTLLAFSHYPALDPLDGTGADERAVLGETALLKRIPEPDVGLVLANAGIQVHFSGHLHANDTARVGATGGFLVNISVPSLVAFPSAYKIISIEAGQLEIETVEIGGMAPDPGIMDIYRREAGRTGLTVSALLNAEDYKAFVSAHLNYLVGRRYLKREWPEHLAEAARTMTLADIGRSGEPLLAGIPAMTFLADWYRVRMGSDLGLTDVLPENLLAYRRLSERIASCTQDEGRVQWAFARLLAMFERFASGLPSRNFTVDMASGEVEPLALS